MSTGKTRAGGRGAGSADDCLLVMSLLVQHGTGPDRRAVHTLSALVMERQSEIWLLLQVRKLFCCNSINPYQDLLLSLRNRDLDNSFPPPTQCPPQGWVHVSSFPGFLCSAETSKHTRQHSLYPLLQHNVISSPARQAVLTFSTITVFWQDTLQ